MAAAPKLRNRYVTIVNDYQTVTVKGPDPERKEHWIVVDDTGREYSRHYNELHPSLVKTRASARSGTHRKV